MWETKDSNFKEVLELFKNELALVEEAIVKNSNSDVALIPLVSQYLTENGGKRIRPLLILAASKLCGYDNGNRHVTYSCAVEFIHIATLLHDDVVDDAKIRRGKKSVNIEWGNKVSVLVADYLFAKSFSLMSEDKNPDIIRFMSKATQEIVEGETLEWLNTSKIETTEEKYLDLVKRKTAVLISASCRIGSVLGEASKEEEHALFKFGENIGIAFQLIDDMLDYFSNQETFGKFIGNDLKQKSITLPLIHAYKHASPDDKEIIEAVVHPDKVVTPEDLSLILSLMKKYKSQEYVSEKATQYIDNAKASLSCFQQSKYVDAILSIADYIVRRDR